MEKSRSPNEVMTPTFVGEQLVYIPLLVFYAGNLAIKKYIEEHNNDEQTSYPT